MKRTSIVFRAKETVEIEESGFEPRLGPKSLLIETQCTIVSPGTELAALTMTHTKSTWQDAPAWLRFPSVPGYLACGRILETGSEVRKYRTGDRLVCEGPGCWNTHTSHLVVEEDDPNLVLVPATVHSEDAALDKMGGIAMNVFRMAPTAFGDAIAILGLGIVGQVVARLASLAGARLVVAADFLESRRAAVSTVPGVAVVRPEDLSSALVQYEGDTEKGFDYVVEATGSGKAFFQACEAVRRKGTIAIVSAPHKPWEIRMYEHVVSKSLRVVGIHGSSLPTLPVPADPWTDNRQKRFFMDLLSSGRVDVGPIIADRHQFQEAPKVYEAFLADPSRSLGTLFYWNGFGEKLS
jgi:2-desacetyl-2-hydroxyethyl bacteriochlorophyllide A dehydrogenase